MNQNISDAEIAVYVAMSICVSNASNYVYCSPDIVSMTLRNCVCTTSSYYTFLSSIQKLSKQGGITLRPIKKAIFVGDSSQFTEIKGNFIVDSVENTNTIMSSVDSKINISILRFWLSLLTTIYSQTKYGCLTIKKMSSMLNLSVNTILKYTKILEDLKILYVYRSNKYTVDSQYRNFKKIANIYGRYQDKDEIEKVGRSFEEQHAVEQTADAAFPSLRSESMRYSHWRKGTHYELPELEAIYDAMKKQNEIHDKAGHQDRIKDLSSLLAEIEAEKLSAHNQQ